MFGDIGLVFNPKDGRYKSLKGKRVKIPLSGVVIPIATDDAVEAGVRDGNVEGHSGTRRQRFRHRQSRLPKGEKR